MYFLTHWPEVDRFRFRPEWPFPGFDKVVHALLYSGWIVLWWWVLSAGGRRVSRSAMGWLAVGAAAYGIFDEVTQAIVGRQPDPLDFACDMLGALGAMGVLALLQRRRERLDGPGRSLVERQAARANSGA
jgi:VanZ family protein